MAINKLTYRNRTNKMLDKVIRKYGYEHPATLSFAQTIETFRSQPEDFHIVYSCYITTMKYGSDLVEE